MFTVKEYVCSANTPHIHKTKKRIHSAAAVQYELSSVTFLSPQNVVLLSLCWYTVLIKHPKIAIDRIKEWYENELNKIKCYLWLQREKKMRQFWKTDKAVSKQKKWQHEPGSLVTNEKVPHGGNIQEIKIWDEDVTVITFSQWEGGQIMQMWQIQSNFVYKAPKNYRNGPKCCTSCMEPVVIWNATQSNKKKQRKWRNIVLSEPCCTDCSCLVVYWPKTECWVTATVMTLPFPMLHATQHYGLCS